MDAFRVLKQLAVLNPNLTPGWGWVGTRVEVSTVSLNLNELGCSTPAGACEFLAKM